MELDEFPHKCASRYYSGRIGYAGANGIDYFNFVNSV